MSDGFGSLGGGDGDYNDMFRKVEDIRQTYVWLFHGGQGTGKTYTAMDFPEPVFVIDTELRADLSAANYPDKDVRVFEPGEISFDNVDPDNPLEDAINVPRSLDNINNAVIQLVKGYKSGDIEGGTVVLDSVTDLWSWSQEWGKQRLMQENEVNEANFRLENQFDWGMIKNKHNKILNGIRTLNKKYDVEVVLTAREKQIPEYASKGGGEHYIKCENTVPFWADVTIRFVKDVRKGQVRHVATFEKMASKNPPDEEFIDPSYQTLHNAVVGEETDDEDSDEEEDDGF